jgi:hypothetical protein
LFGGLDCLTSNDPSPGLAVLARGHPHIATAQGVHHVPGAILAPEPKVVGHHLPGGEVMGQQPPGTSAAQEIQDAVQDVALRVLLRSAPGLGLGHEMLDQVPFLITEGGGGRNSGFHPPMFAQHGCLLQTF